MTEYDYSPDAYERFQAKMAGVGGWVAEQKHHAPKYSNPFVPEQASASTTRAHTPARPESSSRHHDRPQPSRSRTLPAPPSGSGHTSRAYAYAQQGPSDPNSRHRSARSPQRSGTLPADLRHATAHVAAPVPLAPHQVVPRASPVTYAPPPPPGYRTRQVEYSYKPGQPIVLPPPRPGETYVIIPPKGGRVDVVTDPRSSSSRSHSRSQSTSRSTSRGSSSKPSSPTKKNNEALLKRLLNNLTPTVEWGNSSSRSRSSGRTLTREPGRRRSTSR